MKLTKTKSEVRLEKAFPGLISAEFEHEIKSTKAVCAYTGPRIPPAEWHKLLSFFRWTHDTTKSESQARLYVNTTQNTWAVWAYPQKARGGMSAEEIDTAQAREQRQQFKDRDGWIYFGTVHHHCSASAFQSGTDEANEKNQDGLHITVGNIHSKRHDLHCRFYLQGYCFDPNMSFFWDIGDELLTLLPPDLHDRIARHQMGEVIESEFPAAWKENLIEVKTEPFTYGFTPGEFSHNKSLSIGGYTPGAYSKPSHELSQPMWVRARRAVQTILHDCHQHGLDPMEVAKLVGELMADPWCKLVIDTCVDEQLEISDLWQEWPDDDFTSASLTQAEKAELKRLAIQDRRQENNFDSTGTGFPVDSD